MKRSATLGLTRWLSILAATSCLVSSLTPPAIANDASPKTSSEQNGTRYVINPDQSLSLQPLDTPAATTEAATTANSGASMVIKSGKLPSNVTVLNSSEPQNGSTGPHPKTYLKGCAQTTKRRCGRLLKDPLIVIYPIFHPLLASKYLEKHGYSAALGLGIMGASSVAASRK